VASPFQIDPHTTERINADREDMFATVVEARRIIDDSRELLARSFVTDCKPPQLPAFFISGGELAVHRPLIGCTFGVPRC
jgi:hypothetical protein